VGRDAIDIDSSRVKRQEEYFPKKGLDRLLGDLPVGQINSPSGNGIAVIGLHGG
jgi:hypothetical protein